MAEKKSKVKAHRGFAHVRLKPKRPTGDPAPKRPIGRPQRPQRPQIPRLPRGPRRPNFSNQQLQQMSDAQLIRYFNAQRRRNINERLSPAYRKNFLKRLNASNVSPQQKAKDLLRFDVAMANLKKGLDYSGKPIPKGLDIVKQFRQQMKQQQKRFTQKQINDARKALSQNLSPNEKLIAAMGVRRQTAAPAQQAVRNPNIRRRPMTADQRQRMIRSQNTRVAKGGAVRKKK